MTTLSIAIVNYNTRDLLARCLESIRATAGDVPCDVVVVDNASPDGSAAMVRERFPAVRLIEPGRNTWYSAGNNIAIRAARGETVLVLNPDTEIHPGTLQTLLARLEANPALGVVTARQVDPGGAILPICSRFPTYVDLLLGNTALGALLPGWRARRRAVMFYADWDRRSDRAVEVAPGSCLLIRRAALAKVGLFDERMPMYFSDDDLCARIRAAGWGIEYAAGASILHHERASTRQVKGRARQMFLVDMDAFARKYYGAARAALLRLFVAPVDVVMAARERTAPRGDR